MPDIRPPAKESQRSARAGRADQSSQMVRIAESVERSKRSRLLRIPRRQGARRLRLDPDPPSVDYGRDHVDFIAGHDDLVSVRPSAPQDPPRHRARQERMPQGPCYFTAAGPVMRLLRAQSDNRRRSAGPRCSSSTNSATCPSTRTAAGSVQSSPTRTRPRASSTPPTSSSADGAVRSAPQRRRNHRPHRPPRTDDPLRGRIRRKTHACTTNAMQPTTAGPANAGLKLTWTKKKRRNGLSNLTKTHGVWSPRARPSSRPCPFPRPYVPPPIIRVVARPARPFRAGQSMCDANGTRVAYRRSSSGRSARISPCSADRRRHPSRSVTKPLPLWVPRWRFMRTASVNSSCSGSANLRTGRKVVPARRHYGTRTPRSRLLPANWPCRVRHAVSHVMHSLSSKARCPIGTSPIWPPHPWDT